MVASSGTFTSSVANYADAHQTGDTPRISRAFVVDSTYTAFIAAVCEDDVCTVRSPQVVCVDASANPTMSAMTCGTDAGVDAIPMDSTVSLYMASNELRVP